MTAFEVTRTRCKGDGDEDVQKKVSSTARTPASYHVLRFGLGLLVVVLAESIVESYAQFWTSNYDSVPLDILTEDTDIVNALLLTLAALVASLAAFPMVGFLAIARQSQLLANYFATMSVVWAAYVVWAVGGLPMAHIAFVSSLATTSVTYAVALGAELAKNVHDKSKLE